MPKVTPTKLLRAKATRGAGDGRHHRSRFRAWGAALPRSQGRDKRASLVFRSAMGGRALRALTVSLLLAAAALPAPAGAAPRRPGTLDPSFGHNGQVFLRAPKAFAGSEIEGIVRQPDGDLLLEERRETAGPGEQRREIERRLPDGSPDPSFGGDGRVVVSAGGAMALRPDGELLLAASSCGPGALLLLRADGSRDTGFGDNGCSEAVGFGVDRIELEPDGDMLLAGSTYYCPPCGHDILPNREIALARLLPDGRRDAGFGHEGVVLTHSEDELPGATPDGLAATPDGGLLVSGASMVAKFDAGGNLDPGFGKAGVLQLPGEVAGVLVEADGRVVVASRSAEPSWAEHSDFVVSRFDAGGGPDPGYGAGGSRTIDVGTDDVPVAIAAAPGGGVILAGESGGGETCSILCPYRSVLVALTAAGDLEPSFGTAGAVQLPIVAAPESGRREGLTALLVGPSGEAFAAGGSTSADAYVIARRPDGAPATGFAAAGVLLERHLLPANVEATGLALGPGGQISVTAEGTSDAHEFSGLLVRLRENGRPDRRLGGGDGIGQAAGRDRVEPAPRGRLLAQEEDAKYLTRLLPGGGIDRSYGVHGRSRFPKGFREFWFISTQDGTAFALGRLTDRRGMAVYKIAPSGAPAEGFGHSGVAVVSFGEKVSAAAIAAMVQPDGRIVITGWAGNSTAAARLLPDGRPDPSFDDDGRSRSLLRASWGDWIAPFAGGFVIASAASVEDSGRPVSAGLIRLGASGRLVRGFGRGGVVPPGAPPEPIGLFGGRKRVVVVSAYPRLGLGGVMLRAYRPDGRPDPSFGHGGKTAAAVDQRKIFEPVAAARQPDGKIVVAGTAGAWLVGNQTEVLRFR
jgi:uncharacterized delta-60 repeat protein